MGLLCQAIEDAAVLWQRQCVRRSACDRAPCMPTHMRFERESHRLSLFACLSESTWFGRASQLDASAPEHARAQGLPGYREPQTFTFDYGEEPLSYGGLNERCGTIVQRAEVCSDPWVAKQLEADGKVPPSAVCACYVRVRGVCVWSPPPKGASPGRESL